MTYFRWFLTLTFVFLLCGLPVQYAHTATEPQLIAPFEAPLAYPFTRDASIRCGHWGPASQDYPYYGAPRDRNKRKHAGIDMYPRSGAGTAVRAIKDGTIIKVAPFYTRANGEVTYAVLIDHVDFVANYAELTKPSYTPGSHINQGETIGRISGTRQLHFELYQPGTTSWSRGWYGQRPPNLLDPTDLIMQLLEKTSE